MDVVPEDLEEVENKKKLPPSFTIERREKSLVNKIKTPMWKLEELFITEQEARGNSEYTIKHYRRTFKKMYEFFAFDCSDSVEDYEKIYEQFSDKENPYEYVGKLFPMVILEKNSLQKQFGDYLREVDEVNEQTVVSYFRDFRAIMYYAMQEGWIDSFKITIKEKDAPIKNCYTDAEIKKLTRKPNIDDFVEYRNWVIVHYLLATGNRIQTIINLKVADIDFEDRYININVQKNGTTTRIPMAKKLIPILRDYISYYRTDEYGDMLDSEYLFCTYEGEKITDNGLKQSMKRYHEKRGVNKTSIHLYRHTFAKSWIIKGGDLFSLQKMLGHSSVKMVQRYSNLYASDIRKKVDDFAPITQSKSGSKKLKRREI